MMNKYKQIIEEGIINNIKSLNSYIKLLPGKYTTVLKSPIKILSKINTNNSLKLETKMLKYLNESDFSVTVSDNYGYVCNKESKNIHDNEIGITIILSFNGTKWHISNMLFDGINMYETEEKYFDNTKIFKILKSMVYDFEIIEQ